MTKVRPVILCGGSGTRLWPLSTPQRPKQFLGLYSERTMVEETARRVDDPLLFHSPMAVGSLKHAAMLRECLPSSQIVLEPIGRNSAPAIAAAALIADADDLLLILPSDHYIARRDAFTDAIQTGASIAENGDIVTFGVTPTYPATGYGYIKAKGTGTTPSGVERFVEKPDLSTAESYLAEGGFYWNAGIFLFRAQTMLDALEAHAGDILQPMRKAVTDTGERIVLDRQALKATREESIDYAVLEAAKNISIVPVDMGWSDLGDHRALYDLKAGKNETLTQGPVVASNVNGALVRSDGPKVVVKDVDDIAVIAGRDGVLVTPLANTADIKSAVEIAKSSIHAHQISDDMRQAVGDWLFEKSLPVWASAAWDTASGGFVEALSFEGQPIVDAQRRGRVTPRQIFSFARARRLGWDADGRATALIEQGLEYLDGPARSPIGGWAHILSGQGKVEDPRRSLYDHAFVLLAAAEATAVLGHPTAERIGGEALSILFDVFEDKAQGGFTEADLAPGEKHTNPHMHLLEAFMAWFEATGEPAALAASERIALLFEKHFFDPENGSLREVTETDFTLTDASKDFVEPGHCAEWAYLLYALDGHIDRDTASWRRRLIRFAERHGTVEQGQYYGNRLAIDGSWIDGDRRLWPQLERFRAGLYHPEVFAQGKAEAVLRDVWRDYLSQGENWSFVDRFSANGQPTSENVPASMLYHLLTAFGPILPSKRG